MRAKLLHSKYQKLHLEARRKHEEIKAKMTHVEDDPAKGRTHPEYILLDSNRLAALLAIEILEKIVEDLVVLIEAEPI